SHDVRVSFVDYDASRDALVAACRALFDWLVEQPAVHALGSRSDAGADRLIAEFMVNGLRAAPSNVPWHALWARESPQMFAWMASERAVARHLTDMEVKGARFHAAASAAFR